VKLTHRQREFLRAIYSLLLEDEYWECDSTEKRTAESLERRGLVEFEDGVIENELRLSRTLDMFEARLTPEGRRVASKLLESRNENR